MSEQLFRKCHWRKCGKEAFWIRMKEGGWIVALCYEHFYLSEEVKE